jgi:aminoglycoside 6'-N-acetyltransferase
VSIRFEPLTRNDLVQLHAWLQKPHVAAWWRGPETLEEVEADHLPSIDGTEPSYHYVIVVDGRPVGMIQWYLVSDFPEWEEILDVGEGVAGVDLLIGEGDAIGRGLGPEVLRSFIAEVVFAKEKTHAVVAGVELGNTRSLRAFEKAGFRFAFDYEEEGRPHRLLRLERESAKTA